MLAINMLLQLMPGRKSEVRALRLSARECMT